MWRSGLVIISATTIACATPPPLAGPLATCGTFFPEKTAYRADCRLTIYSGIRSDDPGKETEIVRIFDDRGLERSYVRTEPGPGALRVFRTWKYGASGEIFSAEEVATGAGGTGNVTSHSGYYAHRDDRGMATRKVSLVGERSTEYELSPDTCTWSTETLLDGDQPIRVTELEWWHERPSLRTEVPLIGDDPVVEERTWYDRLGLIKRSETREDGVLHHRKEFKHDKRGNRLREREFRVHLGPREAGGTREEPPVEQAWEYDEHDRELTYTVTQDDVQLVHTKTVWDGPFITERTQELAGGERSVTERWEWDCP